jgi:hypothetical protein
MFPRRAETWGGTDGFDVTLPLARHCRGFLFAVGNHIPSTGVHLGTTTIVL